MGSIRGIRAMQKATEMAWEALYQKALKGEPNLTREQWYDKYIQERATRDSDDV